MGVDVLYRDSGFIVTVFGPFDRDALTAMTVGTWHHQHWDQAKYAVVDLRAVTSVDLQEGDVVVQSSLVNAAALSSLKARTATVSEHPRVLQLSALMASGVDRSLCEFRTFSDFDQALVWARSPVPGWIAPRFRNLKKTTEGGNPT